MKKNIKPYKQRGMTCAISCMIMVLEYYKVIPEANWIYEKKYYRSYHSRFMDGTPFSALAWHFAKNGLDTEIVHSEKQMFKQSDSMSDDVFEDLMTEYKEYLDDASEIGAHIKNGVSIDSILLKQLLEQDKLIILAGQVDGVLHAILLCGYEDSNFIVCDPLFKEKQTKSFVEIENFMNTPIGKWLVAVKG